MPVVTHPINAALSVAASGKVTPVEQVLKPGAVIDAQVLATRANLVKIAVTGLMIEVMSEVQLQPGTALKLAVSQTTDGVRLAIVDRQLPDQTARVFVANTGVPTTTVTTTSSAPPLATTTTARVVAPPLQPDQMPVRASIEPSMALQAAAISQAARAAAPIQASLSPLFANLPVIVASPVVPQDVKVAATQLLAARPNLTEALSADDMRSAFKSSGILLEASVAKGAVPFAGTPDLKAALTVFRQLVAGWAASAGQPVPSAPVPQQGHPTQTAQVAPSPLVNPDEPAGAPPRGTEAMPAKPNEVVVKVSVQPEALPARAAADPLALARIVKDQQGAVLANVTGTPSAEGEWVLPKPAMPVATPLPARMMAEPAPPFRGSSPSVQPIAPPSIDPDTPAPYLATKLLDQTDGALARQTLLQVASLPERFDTASMNQPQQRWAFEIPFATPQGTAVAQFEIAEDDSNGIAETGTPKRVWRARFTLDIETTGPVHALVSLVGDKTSVRMWAERPDTAAQLRDNAQALDSALRLADLEPGDIVVQSGAPPQTKPARAGHFLDRAT